MKDGSKLTMDISNEAEKIADLIIYVAHQGRITMSDLQEIKNSSRKIDRLVLALERRCANVPEPEVGE